VSLQHRYQWGEGKMAEAGAKRHFSSTSNFSCTIVCFVFQFVGKDIFCVSRATFFLFVVVIVCYLRASPRNSSKMVSTLYLLGERERKRERERERERERGLFSCSVREGGGNWNTYWLGIDLTHWQQQARQKRPLMEQRRYRWCQPLYHRN